MIKITVVRTINKERYLILSLQMPTKGVTHAANTQGIVNKTPADY